MSPIRNKVSRNVNAHGRIANYMPLEKRRIVMKTFKIESQFYYCPLVHSWSINNKINRLHERALKENVRNFQKLK